MGRVEEHPVLVIDEQAFTGASKPLEEHIDSGLKHGIGSESRPAYQRTGDLAISATNRRDEAHRHVFRSLAENRHLAGNAAIKGEAYAADLVLGERGGGNGGVGCRDLPAGVNVDQLSEERDGPQAKSEKVRAAGLVPGLEAIILREVAYETAPHLDEERDVPACRGRVARHLIHRKPGRDTVSCPGGNGDEQQDRHRRGGDEGVEQAVAETPVPGRGDRRAGLHRAPLAVGGEHGLQHRARHQRGEAVNQQQRVHQADGALQAGQRRAMTARQYADKGQRPADSVHGERRREQWLAQHPADVPPVRLPQQHREDQPDDGDLEGLRSPPARE